MHIIKLNAIGSTNTYLRDMALKENLEDYTVVRANHQLDGRGQMGAVWNTEKGKNLTCSVFKRNTGVLLEDQFYISMVTSLAIIKTLQFFQVPKLAVKWPNDILSEQKKVCGILIENVIKQHDINASIIGIGLNVNQTQFEGLPQASSLKNLTGVLYDIDELLSHIIKNMIYYFEKLDQHKHSFLKRAYEALLFRKNKPSTFKDVKGVMFTGFIQGVNDKGNLLVLQEDDVLKEYALKEVTLLY